MLNGDQIHAFQRDGYVHGGRLLNEASVKALRAELERIIALHDQGHEVQMFIGNTAAFCQRRDCFLQITNLRELSTPFAALTARPELIAAAARLLNTSVLRVFADAMLYKNGHNRAVNAWHQDGPAFDILREPEVLTAWIALDDVGEDDGCVCFARGSHTWTANPGEAVQRLQLMPAQDDPVLHPCRMRRGEVHFHHGLTWHCSLENRNGRPRRGFVVNYIPCTARFNAAGVHYLKQFVESADGEPLAGRHFPTVPIPVVRV